MSDLPASISQKNKIKNTKDHSKAPLYPVKGSVDWRSVDTLMLWNLGLLFLMNQVPRETSKMSWLCRIVVCQIQVLTRKSASITQEDVKSRLHNIYLTKIILYQSRNVDLVIIGLLKRQRS